MQGGDLVFVSVEVVARRDPVELVEYSVHVRDRGSKLSGCGFGPWCRWLRPGVGLAVHALDGLCLRNDLATPPCAVLDWKSLRLSPVSVLTFNRAVSGV